MKYKNKRRKTHSRAFYRKKYQCSESTKRNAKWNTMNLDLLLVCLLNAIPCFFFFFFVLFSFMCGWILWVWLKLNWLCVIPGGDDGCVCVLSHKFTQYIIYWITNKYSLVSTHRKNIQVVILFYFFHFKFLAFIIIITFFVPIIYKLRSQHTINPQYNSY